MEKEKVQATQASEAEKALKVIQGLVNKAKDLKLVEQEANTGFSYFAGKKRLCKLLKSKRGIALEINVPLPKALQDLAGMSTISAAEAHKKHLGTMKHLYRAQDMAQVAAIMTVALEQFKKEVQETKAQDAKDTKAQDAKDTKAQDAKDTKEITQQPVVKEA